MQVCRRRIRPGTRVRALVEKSRRGDFSHTGRRCQTRLTARGGGGGARAIYCKYLGSMHFGRYGRRLNRRQARIEWRDGRMPGGELGIEAALRRRRSHRSCRGFPRSSSLSPGVYLRERSHLPPPLPSPSLNPFR